MSITRRTLFIILTLGSAALVGAFGLVYPRIRAGIIFPADPVNQTASSDADRASLPLLSKAVLSVKGLTCSSCIQEIKTVLFRNPAVQKVFVDIERGKAQVFFQDSGNIEKMAKEITESGYPATVERVLSPDEVKNDQAEAATLSQLYVASIGGWDISRTDYETELEAALHQYRTLYGDRAFEGINGQTLADNLKVQCINRLIDEAIMHQEVLRADYSGTRNPEDEFQKFMTQNGFDRQSLEANVVGFGYPFAYYRKKFDSMILIEDYLESRILAKAATTFEKEDLYNEWFANAAALAEIIYYDADLEALSENAASSASCCPTE